MIVEVVIIMALIQSFIHLLSDLLILSPGSRESPGEPNALIRLINYALN